MNKKKLKNYNIIVNYEDDSRMLRNSFVGEPAVEVDYIAFNKQKKQLNFSGDDSRQMFMSVSILADTPIYRIDEQTGEEYTVTFPKETITVLVNKLIMEGRENEVTLYHDASKKVEGVYLVEHFQVEKGRVESPLFNVPDGSWITTYWVKDKAQYEALKADPNFNGFSIEINAQIEEAFSNQNLLGEITRIFANMNLSDEEKLANIEKLLNK